MISGIGFLIFGVKSIFSKTCIVEYLHPSMFIHDTTAFDRIVLPFTLKQSKKTATAFFSLPHSRRSITSFTDSSIPTACSGYPLP